MISVFVSPGVIAWGEKLRSDRSRSPRLHHSSSDTKLRPLTVFVSARYASRFILVVFLTARDRNWQSAASIKIHLCRHLVLAGERTI
jgi:hypothetical protein